MAIVPVAKGLYLCDYHVGYDDGKVDLYGLFNATRPADGYPCDTVRFCAFAQLANGLGRVPFYISRADTQTLVWTSGTLQLDFPNRTTVVQMAMEITGCPFDSPGLYLVQLFCDNTWVCDATLLLLP